MLSHSCIFSNYPEFQEGHQPRLLLHGFVLWNISLVCTAWLVKSAQQRLVQCARDILQFLYPFLTWNCKSFPAALDSISTFPMLDYWTLFFILLKVFLIELITSHPLTYVVSAVVVAIPVCLCPSASELFCCLTYLSACDPVFTHVRFLLMCVTACGLPVCNLCKWDASDNGN